MVKKLNIIVFALILLLFGNLFAQRHTIAVLQLSANGITDMESDVLTERLRSHLVNFKEYQVLDRDNMNSILEEQGFQLSGCTSSKCMVEVGQLLGVEFMLSGSVGKFGKIYTIDLREIDISSGEIAKTSSYDFKGEMENLLTEGIQTSLIRLLGTDEEKENLKKTTVTEQENGNESTFMDLLSVEDNGNTGTLNASISPKNANVDINNILYSTIEASNLELPIGEYKMKVFAKEHSSFSENFKINQGESTSITVKLNYLGNNNKLAQFKKSRKKGIIYTSICFGTALLSAGIASSTYDEYQKAETADEAKNARKTTEVFDGIASISLASGVGFSGYTIYRHIKYLKLKKQNY